jgi:hypothetical protein
MQGIITLVGPTKFYEAFDEAMLELTKAGWVVLTIGSHRGADSSLNPSLYGYREIFEQLHFEKIQMSDAILVINKGGYFGEHTKKEIEFASKNGKRIFWLEGNGAVVTLAHVAKYAKDRPSEEKSK